MPNIALVDDHALFLSGLHRVIEQAHSDWYVSTFDSGLQLLKAVSDGAQFDLILTDLAMKDINGLGLIRALRARAVAVQVIVLSASEDTVARASAQSAGAFRFLHKSAEESALLQAIDAGLKAGPLSSRALRDGERRSIPSADGQDHVVDPDLSPKQVKVLQLVSHGATNAQIGDQMAISENTVKTHIKAIFRELGVRTRTAAVQRARALALI